MIAIIDYKIGNLLAISNMLNRVGAHSIITADSEIIASAERIILPGNGAFDACMQGLRATGLIPLLNDRVLNERVPLLGICVGAQMLGHRSEEGRESGLGWIDMDVKRYPDLAGIRVPHMGWGYVKPKILSHALTQGMNEETRFYFVHSYFMKPKNSDDILLSANYGLEFAAAVSVDNIVGVQFHPEKSHHFGKQLLGHFAKEF